MNRLFTHPRVPFGSYAPGDFFFLSLSFFLGNSYRKEETTYFIIQEKARSELAQVSGFAESFGGMRLQQVFNKQGT